MRARAHRGRTARGCGAPGGPAGGGPSRPPGPAAPPPAPPAPPRRPPPCCPAPQVRTRSPQRAGGVGAGGSPLHMAAGYSLVAQEAARFTLQPATPSWRRRQPASDGSRLLPRGAGGSPPAANSLEARLLPISKSQGAVRAALHAAAGSRNADFKSNRLPACGAARRRTQAETRAGCNTRELPALLPHTAESRCAPYTHTRREARFRWQPATPSRTHSAHRHRRGQRGGRGGRGEQWRRREVDG